MTEVISRTAGRMKSPQAVRLRNALGCVGMCGMCKCGSDGWGGGMHGIAMGEADVGVVFGALT